MIDLIKEKIINKKGQDDVKKIYSILFIAALIVSSLVLINHKSTAGAAQQLTATISSVAASQTPTDTEPPSDTDNTTGDGCITITPSEIALSTTGPVTADVNIAIVRDDIPSTLTKDDLQTLEITVNDGCAGYITLNKVTLNADAAPPTATANITIAPEAAGSECSIQIADPQGIVDPPLNCEGVIAFTASEEPGGDCALIDIRPASVTVGLSFVPRVVKMTFIGNESASFTKGSALSFDGSGITPLYVFAKDAQTLYATVLVWGAEKGQYTARVDDCSGITFEVK